MAMLAVIATSSMALVRTSYAAWSRHHQDNEIRQSATALIRHLERHIRQAIAVQATSHSGLSLLMPNGDTLVWEYNNGEVQFGVGTATDLLASDISYLSIVSLSTASVPTSDVGLIHTIYLGVGIDLPRPPPAYVSSETFTGYGHLRSW